MMRSVIVLCLLTCSLMSSAGQRVWVDTDAACGAGDRVDVDDCLALLALAYAEEIEVVGISTVFGNASLDRVNSAVAEITARWPGTPPAVFSGYSHPYKDGGYQPPAVAAIRAAMDEGPLVILAIGPLTNVSVALRQHSAQNLDALVVVMGKRDGHLFHPSIGASGGILFGHGPVFSDFNYEKDPTAVRLLVESGIKLTLVPYEASSQVEMTGEGLDQLSNQSSMGEWIAQSSTPWLMFWKRIVGRNGFFPFDLLAAIHVIDAGSVACRPESAIIRGFGRAGGTGLIVGTPQRPRWRERTFPIEWCVELTSAVWNWKLRPVPP